MAKNNNNNKDKEVKDFVTDLNSLLESEFGKLIAGHDSLQHLSNVGLEKQVENGHSMASTVTALRGIESFCRRFGLYATPEILPNNSGIKIAFKPLGWEKSGLKEEDFANIKINISKNGVTVHNTMWSPEAVGFIRGQNGEYNIASLVSIGLNNALKDLQAEEDKINRSMAQNQQKEAYNYINSIMNDAYRKVANLSSAIYSPNAVKDFNELSQKNVKTRRAESTQNSKYHVITSLAYHQSYVANQNKLRNITEKQYTRWLEDLTAQARQYRDFKKFEDEIVSVFYPQIYQNAWFGDLENLYKNLVGKITQGGMTEGTPGKVAFGNTSVPMSITQIQGKKIEQNLQVLKQKHKYGTVPITKTAARGKNTLLTKQQRDMYDKLIKDKEISREEVYNDLYKVAYASTSSWEKAYSDILKAYKNEEYSDFYKKIFGEHKVSDKFFRQIQTMALKGYGNDAVFISSQLAKDFADVQESKLLEGGVVSYEDAEKYVKDILIKEHKRAIEGKEEKKLTGNALKKYQDHLNVIKELESGKLAPFKINDKNKIEFNENVKGADKLLYDYLRGKYKDQMDGRTKITDFDVIDGKFDNVVAQRHRYHEQDISRAGATGDERHVAHMTNNLLAGLALLYAGYSMDEVFIDGKVSKGLNPSIIKSPEDDSFKDKRARTRLMGLTTAIVDYINKNKGKIQNLNDKLKGSEYTGNYTNKVKKEGDKEEEVTLEYLKKASQIDLTRYFNFKENGDVIFDDDKFTKDFLATGPQNKRNNNISNLMLRLTGLAKDVGYLNSNKDFLKVVRYKGEDLLVQTNPWMDMSEWASSSVPEYEGMGKDTHSKVRLGWRENESLKATAEDYENWLRKNKKYDYNTAHKSLRALADETNSGLLNKKIKEYSPYVRNAKMLQNSFMENIEQVEQFKKDMENKEGVYIVDFNDIKDDLITGHIKYDNDGLAIGEKLSEDAFLTGDQIRKRNNSEDQDRLKKTKIEDYKDVLAGANKKTRLTLLTREIQERYYAFLKNKYKEQIKQNENYLAEKFGIGSEKDIQVLLKKGEENFIADIDGQTHVASYIPLALGGYSEASAKENMFLPTDEMSKYNEKIARLLSEEDKVDPSQTRKNVIFGMKKGLEAIDKDLRTEHTYQRTHELNEDSSSGYLVLDALADERSKIFGDMADEIAKKRGLNKEKTEALREKMQKIIGIMNVRDFTNMISAEFDKGKEGRDEIAKTYEMVTGKKWKGKKSKNGLIKGLVDALDISGENYKGDVFTNLLLHSNPTINFLNDKIGGAFVLSSKNEVVAPGKILIDKYLAEIAHRDMDGDRVGASYGIKSKNFDSQEDVDALMSYWDYQTKKMKKISEDAKEEDKKLHQFLKDAYGLDFDFASGKVKDLNSATNDQKKRITVAAAWMAKKGAGIFGNAAFGMKGGLSAAGLTTGKERGLDALGASVLQGIAETLYQEGISAKKINATGISSIQTIQDMVTQKATWDDENQTRAFLKHLKNLGIIKDNGMFKGNTLFTQGLEDVLKDEDLKSELLKKLEARKKDTGIRNKDISAIKNGTLKNISDETFLALLQVANDYMGSHTTGAKSVGDMMTKAMMYDNIPGMPSSNHDLGRRLGGVASYTDFGKNIRPTTTNSFEPKKYYENRVSKILNAKNVVPGPRTTTRIAKFFLDNKSGPQANLNEILDLSQQYAELTQKRAALGKDNDSEEAKKLDEEIDKLTKKRNAQYNQQIKENSEGLEALIKGTASHRMAEWLYDKQSMDLFGSVEEAVNYFRGSEDKKYVDGLNNEYQEYLNKMEFLFPNMTKEEREEKINKSLFKGSRNFHYVASKVAAAGGKFIGSEIPLVSFSNPDESGKVAVGEGTSDIIYVTEEKDEETGKIKRILHIGDYKNTKHGDLKLDNIFQGLDYRRDILDMRDYIQKRQNEGLGVMSDFDAFIGEDDVIANSWKNRIKAFAEFESKTTDEKSPAYQKAMKKAEEKVRNLYGFLRQNIDDVVLEFYSQSEEGLLNEYRINPHDEYLNSKYQQFKENKRGEDDYIIKYNSDTRKFEFSDEYKILMNRGVVGMTSTAVGTDEDLEKLFTKSLTYFRGNLETEHNIQSQLAKLDIEEKSLGREVESEQVNKRIQEIQDKKKELLKKLGPEDLSKQLEDIEEELKELDKEIKKKSTTESRKTDIRRQIDALLDKETELKESVRYKQITNKDYLKNEAFYDVNGNVALSGEEAAANFEEMFREKSKKKIDEDREKEKKQVARDQLLRHVKLYKKVGQELANKNALSKSRLLTEEDKEQIKEEATVLLEKKIKLINSILENQKLIQTQDGKFLDSNGKEIDQKKLEKLGLGVSPKFEKEAEKNAKDYLEKQEHRQIAAFETKAYQVYTAQWKRQVEIDDIEKKVEEAREESNEVEVERLSLRKEYLVKIDKAYGELEKADLEKTTGYNKKSDESVKNLTEMEKEAYLLGRKKQEQEIAKQRAMAGGGNGGPGYSFLGIDAGVSRWLSRLMSGGMLYRFIAMIRRGLRSLAQEAKQLDQAMTTLRIVTGKNAENARTLINQYADLGKKLGATAIEVTNVSSAWLRQGYDISQVEDLITSSMYLSKLGMIDVNEAVKDLTSSMKGFKLEASQAMNIVDKLTALDVKAATTAGDIAQGLSQFANIASLNGVNIDQAAAYVATIADVKQSSGDSVGQSLKTILSRYGNVKAGAYNQLNVDTENEDTTEKLNDVERVLSKMGISIRRTNLEFKDFDEVLDEINEKWNTMDNVSKKAIANAFAGIRQQEAFLVLMNNYDKYQELLEVSENSKGTAERKYQSYKESYAAARSQFVATLEEFANSAQISKLLTDLTKIGSGIIDVLQKIYPYLPAFLSAFGYIRTFQGKSLLQMGANMFSGSKGKGNTPVSPLNDWLYNRMVGAPEKAKSKLKSLIPFTEDWYRRKESKWSKRAEGTSPMYWEMGNTEKAEKYKEKIEAKIQKKELKFKQDMVKYSERELQKKKNVLTYAERELLNEKVILQGEEERKQLSELEKSLKDEGLLKDKESLTYANAISILESGVLEGKQLGAQLERMVYGDRQAGKQTEDQIKITRTKEKIDAAGGVQASAGALRGQALSKVMSGVSLAANTIMTSVSQFATAGNTHEYNGETVESSKEAQKKAGSVSAIISMIPLVGSFLGPYVAESVAAEYDKARDAANYGTQKANERLNLLNNLDSNLSQLGSTEKGSAERHNLVKELRSEIFDDGNKQLQKTLQSHLGSKNLSTLLDDIDSNTSTSAESLRELQRIQIEAKKSEIAGKYSSSIYENQESLGDVMSQIDGYNPDYSKSTWAGAGKGAVAGAGAGALGGLMIGGPWGALIGAIVGTVAGAGIGAYAGSRVDEADEAADRHNHIITDWRQMNVYEKLDDANKKLKKAQDKNEGTEAGYYQQVISLLQKQISIQNEMTKEMNELTLQEGLVDANVKGSYLTDMTIEQLKNIGIEKMLTAFAESVDKYGGLIGLDVWDKDQTKLSESGEEQKKLSESGYDYLFEQIRKQGDEEINAVLSGEAYTLEEILKLRDDSRYTGSIHIQKILRNFADSLNLTTDQLDGVLDKYGKLTLAETYLSTQDLSTKVGEMAELMGSVTEGAGQISSWMEKIISQFPELTYYMGNTSDLLDQTIIKIKQYSHEYVNAQYQSIMDNSELFGKMKDELYDTIGGAAADALRSNKSVTKLADVMAWAQGQYNTTSKGLSDDANRVVETVKTMADKAGMEVVSNVLKSYYDMLIDFRTKQIDKQVENLNSQKEALKEIVNQREYENKLVEARLKLEDANKQKKRVYRAGVGWTYQSDQQAIETAQKELQSLETEKKVSDIDARIAFLEGQKEELTSMYDKENYETLQKLYEQAITEGDVSQNIQTATSQIATAIDGIRVPLSQLIDAQLEQLKDNKISAVEKARKAWEDLNNSTPGTAAYNTALETFHSAMSTAKNAGLQESEAAEWGNYALGKNSNSRIQGAPTAWEVAADDINNQKNLVKAAFALKSPKGYYTGYSNGDIFTGNKELFWQWMNKPLDGLATARVWDPTGERHRLEGLYAPMSSDTGLLGYLDRISKDTKHNEFVVAGIGHDSGYHSVYYKNGQLYNLVSGDGVNNLKWVKTVSGGKGYFAKDVIKNALGTTELPLDSLSLINELGTEAIITPQGTLTALPSKTGVVPADITKNLWELGEVAPSLINILDGKLSPDKIGKSVFDGVINDDSFNIDNLVMNVSADSSFDVDKFVSLIRSRVVLTKNSK